MSLEQDVDTTNTFDKTPIPDGEHEFKIAFIERIEKVKGLYEWTLEAEDGETYLQGLFANEMGDLLRILGCKETSKNKFTFDTMMLEKMYFKATVSHVPDKNKPEIMRQKMTRFMKSDKQADISF